MAYNRWMYSDELYHHGVKGQKWGEQNGPPYPLDRSISDGTKLLPKADGSPQTKKKYKTSEKTAYQRKKRQEKIENSPDYKEKHSLVAEAKRSIRSYQKDRKAKRDALEEKNLKDKAAWDKAAERLNNSDIPWEERKKILQEIASADYDGLDSGRYPASHPLWGNRPDRGLDAEKLNKFIDEYESKQKAARDAAKEHGTAEEVMKYRDTFNKDEWNEIAGRLEAEARVRKLLDKPVQSFDSGSKQNQNSGNSSSSPSAPEKKKLRKIYESGTAEEVYRNRDKFTVEQLEAVERRLSAEEKVGNYASRQFNLDSERMQKLKKIANVIKVVGDTADSIQKIQKVFNGGGGGDGKKKDKNNGGGGGDKKADNSGEVKKTTVVVEETKKDGTTKKTSTWDTSAKGPTSWLNKREKKK